MDELMGKIMGWLPLIIGFLLFIIPYGMLANETYKAVYRTSKVPVGLMIMHYIPFYNYLCTRKYLYGKSLPIAIMSIICALGAAFRVLAIIVWAKTDPIMMVYSVYAAVGAIVVWYLIMAFTSLYTALLTRRGLITVILGTVIAPLGAFIVSKNIRRHFKQALEVGSEFRTADNN